jgi:hypothetical protein
MGWKDILKVLPPSDWEAYPYPELEAVSGDYQAKAKDIGSTRFIVRPHYLDRLYNVTPKGHGTRKRNTDDLNKWANGAKNLPTGKYWMYANEDENDLDVIILNVIGKGQPFPGHANKKKLDRSITNSETGEQITKVVFFTNYFGVKGIRQRVASKFKATRFDYLYTGLKPNHKQRDVSDAKVKRKVKSISIDDLSSPQQTKPDATPEKPKKEYGKLVSEYLKDVKGFNIDLPINTLKEMITEKGKTTWPLLGRRERRDLIDDAKAYHKLR